MPTVQAKRSKTFNGAAGQSFAIRDGKAWQVTMCTENGNRVVASIPDHDYQQSGEKYLQAIADGKTWPLGTWQGELVDPRELQDRRLEAFENGPDALTEISAWTRFLGADEVRKGGEMERTLQKFASEQWPAFSRELFASLFGLDTTSNEPPARGTEWMRKLIDEAQGSPEWQRLNTLANGDPWASGIATAQIVDSLDEKLRRQLNGLPAEDPQRLQEETDALDAMAGDDPSQQMINAVVAAQERADEATKKAQAVAQAFEKGADTVAQAVTEGALAAAAMIVDTAEGMAGLGAGNTPGVLSRVAGTPEAIREALKKNPALREIAKIAGRMRMAAKAKQRTKTRYVPEQIVDVTVGGELARLVPAELMLLVEPETELLLARKLIERQALQYELEGSETEVQGPIVMAVDASGSMSGARFEWAMGVALALLELALTQSRAFGFFTFDTRANQTFIIDRPGQLTIPMLESMLAGQFSGGGTDIRKALQTSRQIIETVGTLKKADVVIVTDGVSDWGDEVKKTQELAPGTSVYGIAIGQQFPAQAVEELTGYATITQLEINECNTAKVDLVFGV